MNNDNHRILATRKESDSIEAGKDAKSARLMERMRDFVLKRPLAESVAVVAISAGAILSAVSCGGPPFETGGGPASGQDASVENESGINESGNQDTNLDNEANDSITEGAVLDSDAGETGLIDNNVNDVSDGGMDVSDASVIPETGDEIIVTPDTGGEDVVQDSGNDAIIVPDTSVEDSGQTDSNVQDASPDIFETGVDVSPEIGPEPMPEASIETGTDSPIIDVVNDPVAEESGPSSPWKYKVVCTVTTGLPSGSDLANFPGYCTLDTAGLIAASKMRSDCYDIRADGLSFEVEEGTCNTANTVIWLKLPLAKGGQGNQVNLLYGNLAAGNGQDASGVWSNGYSAVYHMGSPVDSLGANNLTVFGTSPTLVSTSCQYGKCYSFNNNGGFTAGNGNLVNEAGDFTMSAWGDSSAYHYGGNSQTGFIGTDDGTHGLALVFACTTSATNSRIAILSASTNLGCTSTASNTNTSYQYALTHASGGAMSIFIDGAADSSVTASTSDSATNFNIGYFSSTSTRYFEGTIDEARLHNVVRSADWMKAEYSVSSTNGSEGPNN